MGLRLLALLAVLVLAACGGDDDESAPATVTTAETSSCAAAASDMMAPLGGRVTLEDGRLRDGRMVQSTASPDWWFVAAELDGPGYEDEGDVVTFATTSQFGGEAIFAVDELARAQTSLRDGPRPKACRATTRPQAEARACLGG